MAQRTGLEPATPGVTGRYSNRLNYRCASAGHDVQRVLQPSNFLLPRSFHSTLLEFGAVNSRRGKMAQRTGLEPATPGVTGRYSNRLNYRCA